MNNEFASTLATGTASSVRNLAGRLGINPSMQAGFLAIFGQGTLSAANFFTAVIIGRMCGQTELGLYSLALTVLTVTLALETAFISVPYTVLRHRYRGKKLARYSSGTFALFGGLVLLLTVCFAAVALLSSAGVVAPEHTQLLWTLTAIAPFYLAYFYAHFKAYAQLQVGRAVMIDTTRAVLQIASLLIVTSLGLLSASTAFLCLGVACGLPGITWLLYSWKDASFSRRSIRYTWKRNLYFGKWLLASDTLSRLRLLVPHWLIALTIGTAFTGTYAALLSLVSLINPLMMGFGSYFSPRTAAAFAKGGNARLSGMVGRGVTYMGAALAVYCVLMLVVGVPAVTVLYGEKYSGHGVTIMVMALSRSLAIITNLLVSAFRAIERPDVSFRTNLLGVGMTIAISLVLVFRFGLLGVAIGTLIGDAVTMAVMSTRLKKQLSSDTKAIAAIGAPVPCGTGQA